MRCRKTPPLTQRVGAIGEQMHEGEITAEGGEVPGAIHIGHCLQDTDAADGKYRGHYKISSRTPQLSQR